MSASLNRIDRLFAHNAATIAQHVHLLWDDRQQSYGQTFERASRVAAALLAKGVAPGDRVLLFMPNGREIVELYVACGLLDAICVPVNTLSTARELFNTASDCDPSFLVCHHSLMERVSDELLGLQVKGRIVIGQEMPGWQAYDDALAASAPLSESCGSDGESPAAMIYSSGTTGRPKGILLRHSAMVANAQMTLLVMRYQMSDRSLAMLPLFSSFGFCWDFLMPALAGCSLSIMTKFDVPQALRLIAQHKVTVLAGVPTMFARLFDPAALQGADIASLRLMDVGGGPVPDRLKSDLRHVHGIEIVESYGLTEISPVASVQYPGQSHRRGAAGPALPGIEVKVIDKQGNALPPGASGELCFRSPTFMVGYWNQPELTARTIVEGWLHSGDVGVVDDEGQIYIQDRVKDMIVTGGENVYPKEVENALCDHAAVQAAAVVGVPDEIRGELIHAFVILRSGSTATQEELIEHCASLIGRHKLPKAISFVAEVPLTASGKIQRFQLRAAAAQAAIPSMTR